MARPAMREVRDALTAVFDHAFTVERLEREQRSSWAAIPNLEE